MKKYIYMSTHREKALACMSVDSSCFSPCSMRGLTSNFFMQFPWYTIYLDCTRNAVKHDIQSSMIFSGRIVCY